MRSCATGSTDGVERRVVGRLEAAPHRSRLISAIPRWEAGVAPRDGRAISEQSGWCADYRDRALRPCEGLLQELRRRSRREPLVHADLRPRRPCDALRGLARTHEGLERTSRGGVSCAASRSATASLPPGHASTGAGGGRPGRPGRSGVADEEDEHRARIEPARVPGRGRHTGTSSPTSSPTGRSRATSSPSSPTRAGWTTRRCRRSRSRSASRRRRSCCPPEQGGTARVRIFTPRTELPFAGHPVLGTAWVLGAPLQRGVVELETAGGIVPSSSNATTPARSRSARWSSRSRASSRIRRRTRSSRRSG